MYVCQYTNQPNMKKLKNKLAQIVKTRLANQTITPDIAIDAMMEFYNEHKPPTPDEENPDSDMILFQYGTYDWDGKGAKFELDFTRQIADPDGDEFFQISLTLYYKPADIGDIKASNRWSINDPTIEDWLTTIKNTEGFKRSAKAIPFKYEVDIQET